MSDLAEKRPGEPGMTQDEMRERVIRLIFRGSRQKYAEFCRTIRRRGSPGDQRGDSRKRGDGRALGRTAPSSTPRPGTSDIDLTLRRA